MSPSRRVPRRRRLLRPLGLALGAMALGLAPAASGQSLGPDPYQPYNSMYKPFVYPTAPPNGGIPNMGRLDQVGSSLSPSRGFADYLSSMGIGTADPFGGRPGGGVNRFTPYYQSYRQFDDAFSRRYNPNAQDEFYRDQSDRHRRYIAALRERDPKKRQALLKEIESESRQAARAADSPDRFRDYRDAQAPEDAGRAADAAAGTAPAPPRGPAATRPASPARPGTTGRGGATPRARGAAGDPLDPGPLPLDAIRLPRRPATGRGVGPGTSDGAEADPDAADEPSPSRILERSRYYSDERRPRRSLTERLRLPEDDAGLDDLNAPRRGLAEDVDTPRRGLADDLETPRRGLADDLVPPRRGLADDLDAPPRAPRGTVPGARPRAPRGLLEDPPPAPR